MMRKAYGELLYIADAITARDLKLIYDHDIACVIDLAANEKPAILGRDIAYCRFPLCDDDSNPEWLIGSAIACLRDVLDRNVKTLVACSAGMSRSPTIAAASIALLTKSTLPVAIRTIVNDQPHDISPSLLASVQRVYDTMTTPDGL